MAIDEATHGPNHPDAATSVGNLGRVLQGLGDLKGSKAHFERALEIATRSMGPAHPRTQGYRQDLKSLDAAAS